MQQHPVLSDNPRVLIVEEDEDTRSMLEILLEQQGYQPIAAEDLESVPPLTAERMPDMIILNIPGATGEGLDILREVYNSFSPHQVPIIVTSACALPAFQTEALRAGSNAVFIKPLDFNQLYRVIEQTLTHPPACTK